MRISADYSMSSFSNRASALQPFQLILMLIVALVASQAAVAQLTPEQGRQLNALPTEPREALREQYQQINQTDQSTTERSSEDGSGQTDQSTPEGSSEDGFGQTNQSTTGGSSQGGSGQTEPAPNQPGAPDSLLRQEYDEWKAASSRGAGELMPFGYELFAGEASSFAPGQDVQVPEGYRVGPGDVVNILLTGRRNMDVALTIDRSGSIQLPEVGPLSVHGKTLEELREYLKGVISEHFIGVQSFVSLGELRSINVFVTGASRNPGVYAVNAFSSLSHALSVSGGISMGGTLRDILLLRDGEEITSLDLYSLLLDGELDGDEQLEAGDVIFIPPVGDRVTLSGAVVRPAIYEVRPGATLQELIALSGGLRSSADPDKVQVSRLQPESNRTLFDLSLETAAPFTLANGDEVQVGRIRDWLNGIVEIKGASPLAGRYRWEDGARVSDFVNSRDAHLNEDVDLNYGLIVSRTGPNYDVSVTRFSPRQGIARPNSAADPRLKERDTILFFSRGGSRQELLQPAMEALSQDLLPGQLAPVVSLTGAVRHPGSYPLLSGDRVSDAIAHAGGLTSLTEDLDLTYGLIVSRTADGDDVGVRRFSPREVIARPDSSGDPQLKERDTVILLGRSDSSREASLQPVIEALSQNLSPGQLPPVVTLTGAVRYPGTYPLLPDDTVADLIGYAGGLTNASYQLGAELVRRELTSERAETELIEFKLADNRHKSLKVAPRDRIHIKQLPGLNVDRTVTLQGEFKFPGTYTIVRGETIIDVIERAGGLTEYAFPKAAVFSREALREREQERLDEAQRRLRRSLALSRADAPGEESTVPGDGQAAAQILEEIGSAQAVGRLVIDLPAILAGEASQDVLLRDGDVLSVPEKSQAVTIMGEVQFATSHRYDASLSIDDYINRSGGLTQQADAGRIYVIQADGAVTVPNRSRWFSGGDPVGPGDTIVVPLSLTRLSGLELAKDVTQIIYELSLGAAAVNSLSN